MLVPSVNNQDVLRRLAAMARSVSLIEKEFNTGITGAVRYMQYYPPQPPQSDYIRQGKYGQAWDIRDLPRTGFSFGREAVNTRDYAVWVGGKNTQRDFHTRTGWHTDEDAVREARERMVPHIMDIIIRTMR